MNLTPLAEDLLRALDADDVSQELGCSFLDSVSLRAALTSKMQQFPDIDDLEKWLAGWLGRVLGRRVLRAVGLPEQPNCSAGEMVRAWLKHRGVAAPELAARPQALFRTLLERLRQLGTHASAYELAKQISPETERFFRLLVFHYLGAAGTDREERSDFVIRTLSDRGHDCRALQKCRSSPKTGEEEDGLERLPQGSLLELLQALAPLKSEPFSSATADLLEFVSPREKEALGEIARTRNEVLHGKAGSEASQKYCSRLLQLLESWTERFGPTIPLVPTGAVVTLMQQTMLARHVRCTDESRRSFVLEGVPQDIGVGRSVLVSVSTPARSGPTPADRLRPLPHGTAWETPDLG